jgi:hypothetical protein
MNREQRIRIAANLTFINRDRVLGFEIGAKWSDENPKGALEESWDGVEEKTYVCGEHPVGTACHKCRGIL